MTHKRMRLMMCMLLFAALLLPMAGAIGIAPSRSEHIVSHGATLDIRFKVLNEGGSPLKAVLSADGPLAEHITFAKSTVSFRQGETEKWVSAGLVVPPALEPGSHESRIIVRAAPVGEGTFSVSLGVGHTLTVFVEYPDEYLEYDHQIYDLNPGKKGLLELWLTNRGALPVDAEVEMQAGLLDGGQIGDSFSQSALVPVRGEHRAQFFWAPPSFGDYLLEGSVSYAETTDTFSIPFRVGKPRLVPVSVELREVPLGEILPLTLNVISNWNLEMEGAYAEVWLLDGERTILETLSQSEDIRPAREVEFPIYIDTTGLAYGLYTLKLELVSAISRDSYTLELVLLEKGITLTPTGFTATVESRASGMQWQFYVFLLGLFMTLGVTILALSRRRRRY